MSSVVPDGWRAERLGDVSALITKGTTPKTYSNEGVNFIKVESISTNRTLIMDKFSKVDLETHNLQKRSQLESGDILFSIAGSLGRIAVVRSEHLPANTNQALALIRLKDSDIDNAYCIQQLSAGSVQSELENLQTVGAQPNLSLQQVSDLLINCPPLPEQKKIAAILTSVDEVIESTQQQINKLQDLKKATMNELLTQGIGHTEFKDSELGRIPKSWEVVNLRERFTFGGGSTPSRANTEYFCNKGQGHVWVKTTDLNDSDIFDSEENITKEGLNASSCKIHPAGTVVVAMYGGWNQIGRSGLLRNDASINQAMTAILPSESIIPPFLNYWLVTKRYLWKQIAASSRKDPNITKADVEGFKIVIPSVGEQQKIIKMVDAISHKISTTEIKLTQTTSLKKSLMQDLLTGKVRVTVN